MPNYGLVIGSKFRPFSYQEMLAPVQQSTEAHQALEDTYSILEEKTNIWENMLDESLDKSLYSQYSTFANDLAQEAATLASEGLTPSSRQKLLNLKKQYSKNIVPIEQAYNARKEEAKMQKETLLKNPSVRFSRNAFQTDLQHYIDNPEGGYSVIDLDKVTQDTYNQAVALSKELQGKPELLKNVLGNDYYVYAQQRGFSSEAILAAILDDGKASPVLKGLQDANYKASGVDTKEWDDNIKGEVKAAVNKGLWGAVGTQEMQVLNNWRAQEAVRHLNALDEIAARTTTTTTPNDNLIPYIDPSTKQQYFYNLKYNIYMQRNKDGILELVQTPQNAPTELRKNKANLSTVINDLRSLKDHGYSIQNVIIKGNGEDGTYKAYATEEDLEGGSNNTYLADDDGIFNLDDAAFVPRDKNVQITPINLSEITDEDLINVIYDKIPEQYLIQDPTNPNNVIPDNSKILVLRVNRRGENSYDYILATR